jgi:hypothetical protein
MLILIGIKTFAKRIWAGYITCRRCLQRRRHDLIQRTEWGTLFFVPIVPLRRERILICNFCGLSTNLTKPEAEKLVAENANSLNEK